MVRPLEQYIRSISDFPKAGILFRDITTLLKDASAMRETVRQLSDPFKGKGIQKVVCIESRGFVLGAAIAVELNAGFVPVRKKGKLPGEVLRQEYALEYGTDTVEIHRDGVEKGERILLHDDLLATGGTMTAAIRLVEQLGAEIVGVSFLIELTFLNGRQRLAPHVPFSLISYSSE
jgi:adenine phosphoribosyltransferase